MGWGVNGDAAMKLYGGGEGEGEEEEGRECGGGG